MRKTRCTCRRCRRDYSRAHASAIMEQHDLSETSDSASPIPHPVSRSASGRSLASAQIRRLASLRRHQANSTADRDKKAVAEQMRGHLIRPCDEKPVNKEKFVRPVPPSEPRLPSVPRSNIPRPTARFYHAKQPQKTATASPQLDAQANRQQQSSDSESKQQNVQSAAAKQLAQAKLLLQRKLRAAAAAARASAQAAADVAVLGDRVRDLEAVLGLASPASKTMPKTPKTRREDSRPLRRWPSSLRADRG